jgi:hypothetical protein
MENSKLDKIINIIKEQMSGGGVPVNNVSGGNIAGTPEADPGNPPVNKKKKVIFLGPKSRTTWIRNLKQK